MPRIQIFSFLESSNKIRISCNKLLKESAGEQETLKLSPNPVLVGGAVVISPVKLTNEIASG